MRKVRLDESPVGIKIAGRNINSLRYADDTTLMAESEEELNSLLMWVKEESAKVGLKLNIKKTKIMASECAVLQNVIKGLQQTIENQCNLRGRLVLWATSHLDSLWLVPQDKVRSLGVLLDPELSLEAQVTAVARNAFLQLRLINQLRPYLEYDCLATVIHALVTSRLDFCNALYMGLPLKTVRTLQLVQNRAARLLTGTGHYAHMTPVLRQLHWLPIEARAQFKVLIMTYKALNGLGPGYLNERLLETSEEEHKQLMERKELEILELTSQLKAQEKQKENEIIKLQIEFHAKLLKLQSKAPKPSPNPTPSPQNIFRRKLQHLQEEKNKEIEFLRNTIKDLEHRLRTSQDSHLKRREF
ncbi:hypothetical protein EYD10_03693 [Varanus komodoensis]|nr:hypothetical protein EYD10_03693 [Varanus komodoensis]